MLIYGIKQPRFKYIRIKIYLGADGMKEEQQKRILPKELQKEMLKFFLKTSIPRKKQEKIRLLSKKTTDRSNEE